MALLQEFFCGLVELFFQNLGVLLLVLDVHQLLVDIKTREINLEILSSFEPQVVVHFLHLENLGHEFGTEV